LRLIWILVLAAALSAADASKITYSRDFSGSQPPYVEITVGNDGEAIYREAPGDPEAEVIEFQLSPEETEHVFSLAEKLDRMRQPLESGMKVANMGRKTFRWEGGGETNEQSFNYSRNAAAQELASLFGGMAESIQHLLVLERTIRFDRLGVNDALLDTQVALERDRLAAAHILLAKLDEIADNDRFVNIARKRAAEIANLIRNSQH